MVMVQILLGYWKDVVEVEVYPPRSPNMVRLLKRIEKYSDESVETFSVLYSIFNPLISRSIAPLLHPSDPFSDILLASREAPSLL